MLNINWVVQEEVLISSPQKKKFDLTVFSSNVFESGLTLVYERRFSRHFPGN